MNWDEIKVGDVVRLEGKKTSYLCIGQNVSSGHGSGMGESPDITNLLFMHSYPIKLYRKSVDPWAMHSYPKIEVLGHIDIEYQKMEDDE